MLAKKTMDLSFSFTGFSDPNRCQMNHRG